MSKRSGNNLERNDSKKQRLNEDIDDLWEDDLDGQVLDDCIKLANEVCEEEALTCTQRNNITLLPTYNAFKDNKVVFSSTQVEPSTSNTHVKTETHSKIVLELEDEINKLRKDYELKEGEVSILREQLKDNKIVFEWKEKFNILEKDLKSVRSELEFKNLEIANLKQKLHDLKKVSLEVTLNSSQKFLSPKKFKTSILQTPTSTLLAANVLQQVACKQKFEAINETVYPLKLVLSSILISQLHEKHVIEIECTKLCRNTIPYLQNRVLSNESDSDFHSCKSQYLNIGHILPDIHALLDSNLDKLSSDIVTPKIDKIIKYLWELLDDLHDYLIKISKNMKDEDIQRADANNLTEIGRSCKIDMSINREEIGLKASQVLNILCPIIPYNKYTGNSLCDTFKADNDNSRHYFAKIDAHNNQGRNLLLKLLDIIVVIRKYRKANMMTSFLDSIINLLTTILKTKYFDYAVGKNIIDKLAHEIILSRPNSKVIVNYTRFLKLASHNSLFVEFLFNPVKKGVQLDTKNGILHYNEDTCLFYLFSLMFENIILRKKQLTIDICMNMLQFMFNTYKSNYWIYQRESIRCDCVSHLHKLEIEIVSDALEKYLDNKKHQRTPNEWEVFLNSKITLEVLNLMNFNNYDHIEKYITVFSQFKEVEQTLFEEKHINEMEKLSLTEEIIPIPSSSFANINF